MKILLAVDESETALQVVKHAAQLAKQLSAPPSLLMTWMEMVCPMTPATSIREQIR